MVSPFTTFAFLRGDVLSTLERLYQTQINWPTSVALYALLDILAVLAFLICPTENGKSRWRRTQVQTELFLSSTSLFLAPWPFFFCCWKVDVGAYFLFTPQVVDHLNTIMTPSKAYFASSHGGLLAACPISSSSWPGFHLGGYLSQGHTMERWHRLLNSSPRSILAWSVADHSWLGRGRHFCGQCGTYLR
jgi:hypothetical protein